MNVRYVLEGSVRKFGERLRVTAQLVDGADGSHLWSERYDRKLEDLFALQDAITSAITGTIGPKLEMMRGARLGGKTPADLGAWDCYQRGLWHLYHFSAEELQSARGYLERAVELDSNFALAYARLAYVDIQLGWYGSRGDRRQRIESARVLATRAVELDDEEPAARLSLGRVLSLCGDGDRGVEELRTAVELNPSFAQAHFALGQSLCFLGEPDEALIALDEALRLSPRDPHLWTFLNVRAISHYMAGDYRLAELDERNALRQKNATHWPDFVLVAILAAQGKPTQDAIEALHRKRPGLTCSDARHEFYFSDRPYMPAVFIDKFVSDLAMAGLSD